MWIVKRFKDTREMFNFLNFLGTTKVEYGVGTISGTNTLTASGSGNSQTNYADWTDADGSGNDLLATLGSLHLILNGATASVAVNSVASASVLNLGGTSTNGANVNFELYKVQIPSIAQNKIVSLEQDSNNNWTLIYESSKTFVIPSPS